MRRGVFVLALTILISPIALSGLCFADQDPNDLYGPDSVLFRSRDFLVPCPPEPGQMAIPVYFRNDTPFIGLQVPLAWTGPVEMDSVSFFGSRIAYLFDRNVTIDNGNQKVLVKASVGNQQPIADGRGMLAKFYFSTTDTGYLFIDTVANSPLPEEHLLFMREDSVTYTPQYRQGQFHLVCEQDPNDPNAPDSVSFYPEYAYFPLPSGPGLFYAHLRVANDDSAGAMVLPLSWSGPAHFDSVTFREAIFDDSIRIVSPDTAAENVLVSLIPFHDPPIPPTQGLFTTLCFTLTDMTGVVQIDSSFIGPINHLLFTTTEPQGYCPQFIAGEFPVLPYWPGDVTFDGELRDIADVVYLLNYIYKFGPAPPHPISADINNAIPDRIIDIEDVLYLINYLYKFGPEPFPGDPW
jgi:hypothetical protein